MIWVKRILLSLPFALAAGLTVLISFSDRLHLRAERIAGYGFAFGTPWAWLLDHDWFGNLHSRWVESLITYAVLLWVPALLYSACLWLLLLLRVLGFLAGRVRAQLL
jgi:hypothetical protein